MDLPPAATVGFEPDARLGRQAHLARQPSTTPEPFTIKEKAMRLSRFLYRAARTANDVEAITSGKPERIARRAKNRLLGRLLGKAGVWRKLWR